MQVKLNHNFKQSFLCVIFSIIILFASLVSPPKASAFVITPGMAAVGTFVVAEALVPWLNGFMEANGEAFHNALLDALVNDEEDEMIAGIGRTTITSGSLGTPYDWSYSYYSSSHESSTEILSEESDFFAVNLLGQFKIGAYNFFFKVVEDGQYTLHFSKPVCSCGVDHCGGTRVHYISMLTDSGSYQNITSARTFSETSYDEDLVLSVGLVGGRVYRFCLDLSTSSYNQYFSGYHGFTFSHTPYLTGGAVVNDVPASTRPSGLSTVINDYNTQNINTGGNYTNYYIGTTDANGDVVDVYDFDIFDESTMTITNPASGDTWTATAWEYDYETRSYYCTLENDQYCRITYGDEYVTIIYPDDEGTYHEQYYYYVTAEYTAQSGGSACDHVYTSETTILPTCTESGWRTYTCELCGYSYQSSVPAAGHTWEAMEAVETEYNDNGDVVKLGYTVYTCSVCGATYKAYAQDGQPAEPPSPGGSSGPSGSSGVSGPTADPDPSGNSDGVLSWLFDLGKTSITKLVNAFSSGISYLLEHVIGAVSDFTVRVTSWAFNLFDGSALVSWFDWFSEDNSVINNEFAGSGAVSEVDIWAYSFG